ncbi:methionyl-tRNA formyltransferase, partial [candidate division KSB1 bacterium]|nr:methionyl-tRNA formyltransferase [candidate division KSB1 bacterium]
MSIVFFGTTDTGWHCMHAMIQAGLPVRGLVTGSQEFEISYAKDKVQNLRHRSFKNFQEQHGIPVLTFTRRFDDEIVHTLTSWQPQLFVVIGWYHIIPERVRALAPLGTVGVHWSLLPKYRGGSPLVWAIINGERETGASLFYLEGKVDTGDLIAQERVSLGADEEVGELIAKLNTVSGKMVAEHIPKLLHGTAARWEQEEAQATYFPPRAPEDGKIDWTWPARRIYDFIRAQTLPYPCAFGLQRGRKIKIVKATLQPLAGVHVRVRAGDGAWLGLEKILLESEQQVKWARDYF